MPVSLIHEDDCDLSLAEEFALTQVVEDCIFCEKPTRFWHASSNSPVCPCCAAKVDESHLPVVISFTHPAYQPIRDMTPKHMALREREEDLEHHEIALVGSSASSEEIALIRRKRVNVQRAMRRAGLPVLRAVSLIKKKKKGNRKR